MESEEIQRSLDEASNHYNDGRYDDAVALWEKVLATDPDNERAREGIKMARLLTLDWSPAEGDNAGAGEVADRVQEGVQRVDQLIAAGDLVLAREGVEALLQAAAGDPVVQACAARLEAAADPQAYIEDQLALARHYRMLGDGEQARAACQRVLAVDPDRAEAREILDADESAPSPPAEPADLILGPEAEVEPIPLAVPPPEAPEGAPSGVPSASPEERIAVLVAEGDRLLAEGKVQEAIDVWSRVFVIQDSHPDTERRIDDARRRIEDDARRMEELLYRGEDLVTAGNLDEARAAFEHILQIRPGHAEARSRIEAIDRKLRGQEPAAPPPVVRPPRPATPPLPPVAEPPYESRLPTPPPPPPPRATPPAPRPAAAAGRFLRLALVGVVVLVVMGAIGYLAWGRLFPAPPPPVAQQEAQQPQAAPEAEAVAPPEPELPAETATTGSPAPEPVPALPALSPEAARARSAELYREGTRLARQGQQAAALERFREALRLDPANFDALDAAERAQAEVQRAESYQADLATVREAYADRDFSAALYKLYRLEGPDAGERERIARWIVSCWYDWGVALMKGGDPREAEKKFQEVLGEQPQDRDAAQHVEVARRYRDRPPDEVFRAYTERLEARGLD